MSQEKTRNRWVVVIGAVLIQLALGTIYCWGNMTKYITPYLNFQVKGVVGGDTIPGSATLFIFALGLLAFAITMIFSGQLQQKIGPMKVAILGGALVFLGVLLSAFMKTFVGYLLTYGLLFGIGIGFAYVTPIACAAKWFPDKKGLINGIAVAGFGAGAFFFNILATAIVNPGPNPALTGDDVKVIERVPMLMIILAFIYLVMIVGGALTLRNPPAGFKPAGWNPPAPKEGGPIATGRDYPREKAIKMPQFWMIWGMFVLTAAAGLFTIGYYSTFGKTQDWATDQFFSRVGAWAALFNGLGRVVWGKLSDNLGYKKVIFINFGIQALLMVTFALVGPVKALFFIWVCLIYFCFGGNFSLYPTATTDLFGAKNLGPNYGLVFTAYGIAGISGPLLTPLLKEAGVGASGVFVTMGVMSLIALGINYILKPPKE